MRTAGTYVALVLLTGLGGSGMAAALELRELKQGQHSGAQKPAREVARTQAEWTALGQRLGGARVRPAAPPPKVDFEKEMVLAVAMGTRRTGGYGIRILEAREEQGKLKVTVVEQKPPPDALTIQVLTSPFHCVAVKKSALPVVWTVRAAGDRAPSTK